MTLAEMAGASASALILPRGGAEDMAQREISLVCHDSRAVVPGSLFACIRGEKSDGHDFAAQAVRSGAAAILAERDPFGGRPPVPLLLTGGKSSVKALGYAGHAWRKAFSGRVIGITGTAGKTTLKEMLAHTLTMAANGTAAVARNPLNLNTQIGLPESMLAARGDEDFWVMEAGISNPGDMDELGSMLEPDLAIILNAGAGHALGLGGGAAYHKSRLLRYVAPGGMALVSADYPDLVRESCAVRRDIIRFSAYGADAPYRAEYLGLTPSGRSRCRLWLDGHELEAESALSGSFAAENLIAAASAAHLLGLRDDEILSGLAAARPAVQRFNRRMLSGWTLLDDSYNANPLSCSRMIEAAAELRNGTGSLVFVMGEMLELGELAVPSHEELGRGMAGAGADAVFWLGGHGDAVYRGLMEAGFTGRFTELAAHDIFLPEFSAWEKEHPGGGRPGTVLFKGSRGNHLEKLVKAFEEAHAL